MCLSRTIYRAAGLLGFLAGISVAMPLDSTLYWKIPGNAINPNVLFNAEAKRLNIPPGGFSPGTVTDIQTAVYSDPDANLHTIEVDNFDRTAGAESNPAFPRDRGGTSYLSGNSFVFSGGYLPMYPFVEGGFKTPPSFGRFSDLAPLRANGNRIKYSNTANPRGWIRIRFLPSGPYSSSQISQPYAIKTRALPIGAWAMTSSNPAPNYRSFGKLNLSLQPDRIMYLQSTIFSFVCAEGGGLCQIQNAGGPAGGGVIHPGPTTVSGSLGAIELNQGKQNGDDYEGHNRGFTMIQYLAAQCSDGVGGFQEYNIGSRTVQAYVNQSTVLSNYAGCHGALNQVHVVESTGDDIWGAADKCRYTYTGFHSGSKDFITRIDQLENTSDWARAGIMLRGSGTTPGSGDPNISVFVTPGHGLIFQGRTAPNVSTSQFGTVTTYPGTTTRPVAPIWLKLSYNHSNRSITAYYRRDNQTSWTQMPGQPGYSFTTYLAGIASTSRSSYPGTSVYSGLSGF
jgi:hypothetical protein